MRKKISNHKKDKTSQLKSRKSSRSFNSSLFYYSIIGLGVFILVSFLYPIIAQKKVPCGNSISCKEPPKFEIEKNAVGICNNKTIQVPDITLSQNESPNPVLGINTSHGEKHIYINLAKQTLSAYEGNKLFIQTLVSTGLWGRTPTGDFNVWTKFRATRMSGGSGADYYDLPNVPYVMFFSNNEVPGSAGFSIHGTYWHNNFGHTMSHGCVNMKTTDADKLFQWADSPINGKKGTLITIYNG